MTAGTSAGRFAGKTAIVTGASRGIGLGVAQRLVADGANVVLTGRNQEPLDEAVELLGGSERALGVAGKADNLEHQQETVAKAIETFGALDFLVNNAGINPTYGPLVDIDLGAARKTFEVNSLAVVSWIQQAHQAWMKEHGGVVVNMSSVSSVVPAPNIGFYGATKAMLNSLTELLALELAPDIRVNGVAPGVVKTKFASALYEGREESVVRGYPLNRLGVPEDIGSVVAFLLSDDSSWMTGQTLVVDGGSVLTLGSE